LALLFFIETLLNAKLDVKLILKIKNEFEIFRLKEENICSGLADSAGAAGPMNKAIDVAASTLDNYIDIINVESSSSDIGRYKDCLRARVSVTVQSVLSLSLL
jgi:hypothetical protein